MNFYVILVLEGVMEEKKDFDSLLDKILKYNPEKDSKKEDKSVKEDKGENSENKDQLTPKPDEQ